MAQNLPSEGWTAMCERIERATGPVAWRWAATSDDSGKWGLVALVVDVGVNASPSFERYRSAIVAVEELAGEAAGSRLREGRISEPDSGAPDLSLPVQENVVPQRVYSSEPWALTESGWPRLLISAGAGSSTYVDGRQPLQATEMTFYPSLGAAVAEKVFCISPALLRLGQHPPVLVRILDRRGRIAQVGTSENQVFLAVEEGEHGGLKEFALRVAWRTDPDSSEWSRRDYKLGKPGRVEIATEEIPAELVAILVDVEGSEIDRCSWSNRFDRPVTEPESLEGLVVRWLSEGEHGQLEYKQELQEKKTRVSFAETVAAFANGAGGAVLVGVNDEGAPIGYGISKTNDQVTNIIVDLVEEKPHFEVRKVQIDGKPIVVVRVAPSLPQHRPHQVKGRIMVRTQGTTRQASPSEVRRMTSGPETTEVMTTGFRDM
jgi:hypothetical protein